MSSINTNIAASVAVASLNATQSELAATEKQVSTGYRVADATDDGAAFAVAQRVRSDVGALTTANQQLGSVKGLVATTLTGLTDVSNTLNDARKVLTSLASSGLTTDTRKQYAAQYVSDLVLVRSFLQDAVYSGKTLVGDITGSAGKSGFADVHVVRNEAAATYNIGTFSGSAFFGSINLATTSATLTTSTGAAGFISTQTTTAGVFIQKLNELGSKLNYYGAASNYVDNTISYNSDKITSLNNGLGSLVDADLTKEAAQLQALQTKQQLATQALSIANQAPQTLLSLFK